MALAYSSLFIDLAARLITDARRNGGATLDPITMSAPHSGYMVGGLVPSLVTDAPKPSAVADWIADSWAMGEYVGSWLDPETGLMHFDISTHVRDRDLAIALGERRQEIAIFDLNTMSDIRLGV